MAVASELRGRGTQPEPGAAEPHRRTEPDKTEYHRLRDHLPYIRTKKERKEEGDATAAWEHRWQEEQRKAESAARGVRDVMVHLRS